MRRKKGIAQILLATLMLLAVGFMTADIMDVKGSMTEQTHNIDSKGYDVYFQKPIDVSTYKLSKPMLKIYSVSVEHEFNSMHSAYRYNDIQFLTPDGKVIGGRGSIFVDTRHPRVQVSLNADILTEYYKGKDQIDIYAVVPRTGSKDTVPSTIYMTMELNDMTINYDPIECTTSDDCNDNRIDTTDICFEHQCNYVPVTPSTVEERTPDVILDIDEDITYIDYLDIDRYYRPDIEPQDKIMTSMDKIMDMLSYIKLWISFKLGL